MRRTFTILMVAAFVVAMSHSHLFAGEYQLDLKKGRNFVSLPLSINDTSVSGSILNLFGSALDKLDSIEYFDTASGQWLIHDAASWGEQELEQLANGAAFYVNAKEEVQVTLYGNRPDFLDPPPLAAGWNAIGVAQPVTVSGFAARVPGFDPEYDRIYQVEAKGVLVALKLTETMTPGGGYWLDNDPDGDGVMSSVEIASYQSSPLANDLVADASGAFKLKDDSKGQLADADQQKIDYLLKECSQTYLASLPESLDELHMLCRKFVDEHEEYTVPGGDVILGVDLVDKAAAQRSGFTVSKVRYKLGEGGRKIAGIGTITPGDIPAELKPLLGLLAAEAVFLDLKDEKVLRAVGETVRGFHIGGDRGLSLESGVKGTKFDALVIEKDGSLEIGLSALDSLVMEGVVANAASATQRSYFVKWSPDDRGFIQLSLLLGDEEEPGDEVTASRVWYTKDGKAEPLVSGGHAWLLNLPPGTAGVFEPFVKAGGKEMAIAHAQSPSLDHDFSTFSWFPATPEVSGELISFTGPASQVQFMSELMPPGSTLSITGREVRVDEKGVISVLGTTPGYRFDKGAFVIGYPALGLDLYFEGWKRMPDKSGKLRTGLVASWRPSFKAYLGYRSDDLLKEVSVAVPLSVQVGSDMIRKGPTDFQVNVTPRLLGFGWGLDGKLLFNLDGYEVGVSAGIERKEEELYRSGNDAKKLVSTLTSVQFPSVKSKELDVVFSAKVSEQYLMQEAPPSSGSSSATAAGDREGYRSRIELSGEGRYRLPADLPLVGGSDLSAVYRAELQYKGKDSEERRRYLARTQVSLALAEGANNIREEDGWRFAMDELRLELEEVEITGAGSQLEAIGIYLKPSAPKGVKRFTGFVSLNPPEDFLQAGPFEASLVAERLSALTDAEQKWRMSMSAEMDARLPLEGEDNYLLLRQLVGVKETGQNWNFGAVAEMHLGERVITGDLFLQRGGIYTFVASGYDLDDTFKGLDLVVNLTRAADGKSWQWSASLGGTVSGKALAELLGQDGSLVSADLMINGTLSSTGLTVKVDNVPFNWGGLPDWIIMEKIRNITYTRQLKSAGGESSFSFDLDVIFTHFADTKQPREQWPRFTMGALYSSRGLQVSGSNIGPMEIRDGAKLTILEAAVGFGNDAPEANKAVKVLGSVQITLPDAWLEEAAAYATLPREIKASFEYSKAGFRSAHAFDTPPVINLGAGSSLLLKRMEFTKASPWRAGLTGTLTLGGKDYQGLVELGEHPRFVLADSTSVSLDLTGGYRVSISQLGIDLSSNFALSGDAVITMPEGNAMNSIVGSSFAARLSGSPEKYSFSTKTNISSKMDMGLLGEASFTITSLSLSSDGSFAGSGSMKLAGQTTSFVIGTRAGGLYFMADFGAGGIDIKLASMFMLKVKNKIGLESLGAYQYLRIDDLNTALGNQTAGADLSTNKFLYFLPSSIPPVGFAFFDKLEGKVSIAGFAVGLGMSFPAPQAKDLGAVVGLLGQAFTGGAVDLTRLEKLSSPAFGLNNVSLIFPKVPGFKWESGGLKPTDNLFAAMFGSDKLVLVSNKTLKAKDFIQAVTADSTLDVIKVVAPAELRKGSLNMNILGFNSKVNYDLREDQIVYEKKLVAKLPDMHRYLAKVRQVESSAGGLPAELQGSGGSISLGSGITGNHTELKARHSGKCLEVAGMSTENGASLRQWACLSEENQQWKLTPDGGEYYRIEAKLSGKCLEVSGAGAGNGANVGQCDCSGKDSQRWKPVSKGDGYYQLQAKHSGRCLDVSGAGSQDGANLQQWDCGPGDNQKWLISQGAGGSRSKSVNVALPAAQGGGTAKVTWTVEDITAELKAIKDVVAAITPPLNATWQSHFSHVWNQFSSRGVTFSGNRASFQYSPTITAELELTEYDGLFDITGVKRANNQLYARFGSATLYAENNFEGKSLAVSDDLPFNALSAGIGNDNLSSVKIEGRGKIKLFQHSANQGNSTEVTGSLDTLEDSAVKDNDASSIQAFYPMATGSVTGWRLVLKSNKGILATVDAGGMEVVFPGDQKILGLLPTGRMAQAIRDTKSVLADLKPYPDLQSNPGTFLTSFWNQKVLPIKADYLYGAEDDLEGSDKPVQFKTADGGVIGFQPLIYGVDRKVNGVRFDKETGVLTGKFGKVTLFSDGNYTGKSLVVEDDIPNLADTEVGNDAVSSVKVEDFGKAVLYSGTNYMERWYYDYRPIKAKHSGKVMDESSVSSRNGGNVHQWDFLGNDNQKWKLVPDGSDFYRIVARHSGKCLDVAGGGTHNGANLQQWDCAPVDQQRWKLIPKGGSAYQLKAKHSGRCIDVQGGWGHNGANIHQWDCHEGDNQRWLMDLAKLTYATTAFEAADGWVGDNGIGNDTVRSIRVFNPLEIGSIKEWRVQRSTPSGGTVTLAYTRDIEDGQYKSLISTELQGTGNRLFSYYDEQGNLEVKAFAKSEAEFPLTNYRAVVRGTPYDLTDIMEAGKYIRVVTKTIVFPDNTTVVINDDGGLSGVHQNVVLSPAEGDLAGTVFILSGPDGMSLKFSSPKTGGVGNPEIAGSNPLQYASLYRDDAGVPQGIKKVIGQLPGGLFLDAGLNLGTSATVQLNLQVSGAIQTDGNFYLKGNGNLVIANYTVSEAVVELSSDNGLAIRGKMDLFGSMVAITGYLKPDGVFSFTGVAQVMVSGTGVKGALAVNNSGVNINGSVYIANKKITGGVFAVQDGKVSWKTKVSIGYAGFDSTTWIQLKNPYGPGYAGRAYINLDVPIYVWGPKGWKCKRSWGIKICWPKGWGNIRVGTLPLHFNQAVSGSLTGSAMNIKLGPATLSVDVAKPSVSAKW